MTKSAEVLAIARIRGRLLQWYDRNQRDLPWRQSRDPYHIWISEIMLQQTRVTAVLPYYSRFLGRFPDVRSLASAPEQELLAAWAGLGYYSRARNLQKAARMIVEQGGFPRTLASLRELPGVGDYTAAAVASIAFGLPHAAMDGNVARVLSRLTAEPGSIKSEPIRARLRGIADALLDLQHPGDFNQALMELGATVCLPRRPLCTGCPLELDCGARQRGIAHELPVMGPRPSAKQHAKKLLIIEKAGRILFWQRPANSSRLAGFWELPEHDQLPKARITKLTGSFRHTIVNTTYLVEVLEARIPASPQGFRWVAASHIERMPVSTTAKKALALFARAAGKPLK